MQTIKPVMKYPGAKWKLAKWIVGHMPSHVHYVEPFFGSGAVFFNKRPAKHEVVNDLSGDVVNLFRVMRERSEELIALLEMTPWAREEYQHSYEPTSDPLEQSRRFMVRVWQAHGGTVGVKTGWANKGMGESVFTYERWTQLPCRIRAVLARLRTAEIENKPALEIITRYCAENVLIYADPPYVTSTRVHTSHYQHEMTDADHAALLDALDAHPGPVLLSGYACALYDNRLTHWQRVTEETQAEKGNTRTEVLWINPVCAKQITVQQCTMFDEVAAA